MVNVLTWSSLSHGTVFAAHIVLLQTSAIDREKNMKTLIVDYINKNIFVLSWTFNYLFCYELEHQFPVSGRPSTRHAFVSLLDDGPPCRVQMSVALNRFSSCFKCNVFVKSVLVWTIFMLNPWLSALLWYLQRFVVVLHFSPLAVPFVPVFPNDF